MCVRLGRARSLRIFWVRDGGKTFPSGPAFCYATFPLRHFQELISQYLCWTVTEFCFQHFCGYSSASPVNMSTLMRRTVDLSWRTKMAVFSDVAPCSLVDFGPRFSGDTLMMEAISTSEASVNFYQTTQRNNREGSHLQVTWVVSSAGIPFLFEKPRNHPSTF
jgi:hypothetical protein